MPHITQVESTYNHFLALTGEPNAAAALTQCVYLQGEQSATNAPLSVADAARALGVSSRTVYDLCESGKLRHSRIGRGRGTIRITREAIAELQHACEPTPAMPRDLKYLARVAGNG